MSVRLELISRGSFLVSAMGFNIHEEGPPVVEAVAGDEKQVLKEIFQQHCEGQVMAVTPWLLRPWKARNTCCFHGFRDGFKMV